MTVTVEVRSFGDGTFIAALVGDRGVIWQGPVRRRRGYRLTYFRDVAHRTAHEQAVADGQAELELRRWLGERSQTRRAA